MRRFPLPLPRPTIHLKVMLLIGAALCLLLALTGYFALQNEKRFLLLESEKRSRNLRRSLEALARVALVTGEQGPLEDYLFRLAREDRDVRAVSVYDAAGKLLVTTGGPSGAAPAASQVQSSPLYIANRLAGRIDLVFDVAGLEALLGRLTGLILAAVVDCLLFIGLILHLALKHFVTRPLGQFIAASHRIADGDFGASIPAMTRDELADLAAAFNHMSANLERFRSELSASNRLLEDRVRQRTAELESEMARTRELALQVQRADRLSSLGTLAAGVAHELNNPIGNISTFVQILQEKTDVPRELLVHCLGNLSQETDRASRIIRKLLTFARHDPISVHKTAIGDLVEQAVGLLATSLRDAGVELHRDLPGNLPPVPVDASGIVQVLVHLMTNAMHAMPEGGSLTFTGRKDGDCVTLALADTGAGIASEHLGRVFDPFFTTKDVGRGTGLGLSVSYGIVREHGGRITVSSEVGRGSTFTLHLPLSPPTRTTGSVPGSWGREDQTQTRQDAKTPRNADQ
ncbi:MAG: HAMP domain-containing protein [Candidatus Riflebacteria bacterium]|nr:HAMP domain-containing protein [Candidatus Riflebacteria bacterium]